jgi:hypothetical protein
VVASEASRSARNDLAGDDEHEPAQRGVGGEAIGMEDTSTTLGDKEHVGDFDGPDARHVDRDTLGTAHQLVRFRGAFVAEDP